jgi:predicted acyltransferase
MYQWGMYGLILGLAFEPYQGGIKKDPATMSYFFITTVIAIFLLMILTILIDGFQQKPWFGLLIDTGKNPMIGYIAFANLLWPILELKGWTTKIEAITNTPTLGFLRGLAYTLIIALFVSLCTRLKLFWKT